MSEAGPPSDSVYTRLGGEPAVRALVDRFYQLMDQLPEAQGLPRLHPDLPRAADSLFKYLSGWFGGPPLYVQERGHPRLRMRHLPFTIGRRERDQWLLCMRQALAAQAADVRLRAVIEQAFAGLADHMVNRAEPG